MVVFRGAEAYISPSWYPSKHEAHRQVPTWNYEVVHAHGTIVGIEIALTSLMGKVKLSQNKEARDRHHAADTLDARGHSDMAQAMRKAG